MNPWSALARLLSTTALDCWRAALINERARTSGTQICTGRSPWARRRSRCNLTLSRDERESCSTAVSCTVTYNLAAHGGYCKNPHQKEVLRDKSYPRSTQVARIGSKTPIWNLSASA